MKLKYDNDVKLCYMDTDSFVMNIKTEDFYKDIANAIDKRFDTSNYEVDRPLPTGKNKKVIELMKDELGRKIITEFITLRPKAYTYLTDQDKDKDKLLVKDKLLLSKEREIFKDIYNKRLDKIEELNNKIDYDNLQYVAVNSGKIYNFSELTDPLTFLNEIKKGNVSLEEAKNTQQNYLNYLNIIRKGNKNAEQKKTLANINIHFNARNNAIKCIED